MMIDGIPAPGPNLFLPKGHYWLYSFETLGAPDVRSMFSWSNPAKRHDHTIDMGTVKRRTLW